MVEYSQFSLYTIVEQKGYESRTKKTMLCFTKRDVWGKYYNKRITVLTNSTVEEKHVCEEVLRKMGQQKVKDIRLHEGELNVMELLWSNKVLAAKDIAKIIKEYIGWEKNTTYTYIKRLIDKGAITREDPGFLCRAAISKKRVQEIETGVLIKNLFNGSLTSFIHEYFDGRKLSSDEVLELQKVIETNR